MGQFSWICSDDNKALVDGKDAKFALLLPDGGKLIDTMYDGYGHVCGKDIYALVAIWNRDAVKRDGFEHYANRGSYCDKECLKDYLSDMSDKDFEKKWGDDKIRDIGIDIACYDEQNAALEKPIKLVHDVDTEYDDVGPSKGDPNQGWVDEDEVEEDEYDDYEDEYEDYDPQDDIDDEECGHDEETLW